MTRDDYLAEVRHAADAESSNRWPTARLLQLFHTQFRREWRNILNTAKWYRFALRTPTTDANGRIALTDLSSGSGDSVQTFYRIIRLAVGDRIYGPLDFEDAPTAELGTGEAFSYFGWYPRGSELQILPRVASQATNVWVNHFPVMPMQLSAGGVALTFPTDYELVPVYETAGFLLTKGGLEPEAGRELKQLAEEMRRDMLADLGRISTDPLQVRYSDSRGDWGG